MNRPNMNKARKRMKEPEYIYDDRKIETSFSNKKYFLRTYGCQMNVHDSEEMKYLLEESGFSRVEEMENADLVLLNTCAIRENAHDKLFGFLGRCKHLKEQNNDLIIVIAGCMPQTESVIEEFASKHPYIDLVIGTHNINELPFLLNNLKNKTLINVHSKEGDVIEFSNKYRRDSKISAYVNIMYGCDKFCTYCIVPYTRGKERSRKSKDIIDEIKELKKEGYKEVTLLGQNVNAYGKDLKNEIEFADLLLKVSDTEIDRIRFMTSHPWDFTDNMIKAINKRENIMPYVHLPVQSGSNKILSKMNRKYTKEEYLELFNSIKKQIKDVSITTDIIVGFPNETTKDFEETLDLVNKCQFDGAFTFIYSKREGTPASNFEDPISLKEKKERLYKLNKLINNYRLKANEQLVDKTLEVLVLNKLDDNMYSGHSACMKLVNIKSEKNILNDIVKVKIKEAKSFSLDGIIEN